MMKNKISFAEIKKYLEKKGFTIKKRKLISNENHNVEVFSKTLLSSLIIISIFFITPIFLEYNKKQKLYSKDYENNSKIKYV